MQTTLADRLKYAMAGPPKITGLALAKACGVSQPSVSDWLNGTTKSMDGVNLIAAAEFLRVNPKWLATGLGLKIDPPSGQSGIAREPVEPYCFDKWTSEAIRLFKSLQQHQREGALAALKTHISHLDTPENGQTLRMAG
jgi:transcriptional regulator with XRE-family HTH domain